MPFCVQRSGELRNDPRAKVEGIDTLVQKLLVLVLILLENSRSHNFIDLEQSSEKSINDVIDKPTDKFRCEAG